MNEPTNSNGIIRIDKIETRGHKLIRLFISNPFFLVVAVIVWNLYTLRSMLVSVPFLDDASMHEQMVRDSATLITHGRLPLESWFPYLGLGSPHFLHYQSGGAMLAALIGIVIGPNTSFRWTTLLLVSSWPLSIYVSSRIFGMKKLHASVVAVLSPLIISVTGIGYEDRSYMWIGYGLWSQLWAQWTLPIAVSATWKAISEKKFLFVATLFTMLTAAFHFETAYLEFLAIITFPFFLPSELKSRIKHGALLLVLSLFSISWIVIPLLYFKKWTAINQVLAKTGLVNGYGARQSLDWLFSGNLLDFGRFPVLTSLLFIGVAVAILNWNSNKLYRCLVLMTTVFFVFSFGPTTFGKLANIIPGHSDIFFRRFVIGFDLGSIFLCGVGLYETLIFIYKLMLKSVSNSYDSKALKNTLKILSALALTVVASVVILPAEMSVYSLARDNSFQVNVQKTIEVSGVEQLSPIISYIKKYGLGRTYAGLPTNWGYKFYVGEVPVFKYLESQDVDEVGYTLRTASLMTDPENYFNDNNISDFILFGIRYLILPQGKTLPVGANLILKSGEYTLWVLPNITYFNLVTTVGVFSANRKDVGIQSIPFLNSNLMAKDQQNSVSWDGAKPSITSKEWKLPLGKITKENVNLQFGSASTQVSLTNQAIVELAVSYDPGWTVTVDGVPSKTILLAPAVVGVLVPKGNHTVSFVYAGFKWYPELFALAIIALAVAMFLARKPSESADNSI